MSKNGTTPGDQLLSISIPHSYAVEIANALSMRLQALDLARHTVIAPNLKRYVVATFDDTRIGRGYVTAVYPQQNDYLTLIRLPVLEVTYKTPEDAIKRHIAVAQAIQKGKLKELNK
jgi:hypothetical protein